MKFTNKREQALQKLGGKCVKCGTEHKLHLHHVKYAKDSVDWRDKNESNNRIKEALEHPERFELVCAFCHAEHHNVPKSILDRYPRKSENS